MTLRNVRFKKRFTSGLLTGLSVWCYVGKWSHLPQVGDTGRDLFTNAEWEVVAVEV